VSITIIITHYSPPENSDHYKSVLANNINSLRSEKIDFPMEIILCDDGSEWSKDLIQGDDIYIIPDLKKIQNKYLTLLDVDLYLRIPSGRDYKCIMLKEKAVELSKYENILFLDDDTILNRNALNRFKHYLNKYEYVKGRIINTDSMPNTFFSKEVQGTNYAIKKKLYKEFMGFSKYLFLDGFGEDDDITWQVYNTLEKRRSNKKLACFAGDIIGKDLETERWSQGYKGKKVSVRRKEFEDNFISTHGVNPNNNKSRHKKLWMEIPSIRAFTYEIIFILLRFIKLVMRKFKRITHLAISSENQ